MLSDQKAFLLRAFGNLTSSSILPPRPSQPAATAPQPAPYSHSVSTRSQHPPPIGQCSDPKRPRIPSQGSAPLGSHPGYRPQFCDNTRPVGSSASSSARSSRGPYAKGKDATTGMAYTVQGKGADKGTFKGKDSFPPDWPPLTPGPPKSSSKHSSGVTPTGFAKGPTKGKSHNKGIAPPTVFAPPPAVLADHKLFPFDIILLPSLPRGQPGHIVRLVALLFLLLLLSFPSAFLFFFCLPCLLPLPPFSLSFPFSSSLSRCLPKVALPKVAAPLLSP